MSQETYGGPMPPEVSEDAVKHATGELRELACHYGWSDEELESDILEIADYIQKVSRTTEPIEETDK